MLLPIHSHPCLVPMSLLFLPPPPLPPPASSDALVYKTDLGETCIERYNPAFLMSLKDDVPVLLLTPPKCWQRVFLLLLLLTSPPERLPL